MPVLLRECCFRKTNTLVETGILEKINHPRSIPRHLLPGLNQAEYPHEIDLSPSRSELPAEKPLWPGIYEITGDKLKLCFVPHQGMRTVDSKTGKIKENIVVGKRPTSFDGKEGGVLILKREKK